MDGGSGLSSEAGERSVESQFPMNQIPVAFRVNHGIFRQLGGVLCSGIGQWIGGADGQYTALRDFQSRESGGKMIEPAPK